MFGGKNQPQDNKIGEHQPQDKIGLGIQNCGKMNLDDKSLKPLKQMRLVKIPTAGKSKNIRIKLFFDNFI